MRPAFLCLFICIISYANAQTGSFFAKKGIAINGYDPVAYFSDSMAVEGSAQFSWQWQAVEWRFKNQANRDTFQASPEKYAPQFGGFCAYGLSNNYKAPTEPDAFTIIHGKLYLNYNTQVRSKWSKNMKSYIEKAEANWVNLKDKTN